MIVKIKRDDKINGKYKESWVYFEGDKIVPHIVDLSNTDSDFNRLSDTLFILKPNTKINQKEDCACGEEHNFGLLLTIEKENKVIGRVITNRTTYLMNDSGKTVDKLF